jgi:hypothetical protein
MGPRLLLTEIIGSSSVSPFVVATTTPLYFFFYKRKERGPPTKILRLFPNPLLLEPDAISFPTLRELRFGLD